MSRETATLCPVHGSALCPEDYMLLRDGTPRADYAAHWHEGMRCGLRRPVRLLCASTYRGPMGEWDICGLHPFHDGKHDGDEFDWTDAEAADNGS